MTVEVPISNLTTNDPRVQKPDLRRILNRLKDDVLASIFKILPGKILSFDSDEQTASVEIMMKRSMPDGIKEFPVIQKCPVIFLGGGNSRLTFPISSGDPCLILFADRDIDNWSLGGGKTVPNTRRYHNVSDAIVLVGLRSIMEALDDFKTNGVDLSHFVGSTTARLELEGQNKAKLSHGDGGGNQADRTADGTNGITDEHGNAKMYLQNGTKAELDCATSKVSVQPTGVQIALGINTLRIALDSLCTALVNFVDTRGDTPNSSTLSAINAAKAAIDGVLI